MPLSEKERLELLLKIRWAEDPCRQMRLTPTQKAASECTARYIAIRGQNRGGKTAFSAYMLARIARHLPGPKTTNVKGLYIVFAPTREQLQDPWGKKLLIGSELQGETAHLFEKPFIPEHEIEGGLAGVKYTYGAGDRTVSVIPLKNGDKIHFRVSGAKNNWKGLEGKGMIKGIVFDESAGTQKLLSEAMTRLLDAHSHPQIREECGGGWLIWGATQTKKSPAFEHFLSICQAGDNPEYQAFSLLPGENPAIRQDEREKMAVVMDKEEYEVRMLGHGSAASNMALYPQWDDDLNLVPKGQEYEPGLTDNLWVFYDPGTHYTGIVFAAVNRLFPSRVNVVQFVQTQRTTLEYDVKLIRDWLGGRWLEGFVYDQAARKLDKTGSTVAGSLWKLFNQRGYDIRMHRGMLMGKSEYALTVPLMRSALRCPPGSDVATNLILNRESGCGLLRWQIMNCAFKENAYDLKESNIQEGNDHGSDALRYGISRRPTWIDRGNNPKLWGDGIAEDPDADRKNLKDHTPGDAQFQFTPQTGEAVDPAARQRRKEAANREKRVKQARTTW